VREESHLDDMRAAIRGDFERLEERRGEQELMRIADEPEDRRPEPAPEPDPEPSPPSVLEGAPATEPEQLREAAQVEPEPEVPPPVAEFPEPEPVLVADDDDSEGLPPARSWLDRLLGR